MEDENKEEEQSLKDELENADYIGNIWGWRTSIYAAIFILLFIMFAMGRYVYLVSTDQYPVTDSTQNESVLQNESIIQDSINQKE